MNRRITTHLIGAVVCLVSCALGATTAKITQVGTIRLFGVASAPRLDESILIVAGNSKAPIVVTDIRFAEAGPASDVLIDVRNDTDRTAKVIRFVLDPMAESRLSGIPLYPFVDYGQWDSCWLHSTRQAGPPLQPGESVTIVISRDTYENRTWAGTPPRENDRVPRLWLSEVVYTDGTTFQATCGTTAPPN